MDAVTKSLYEAHAQEWTDKRGPKAIDDGRLEAFAKRLAANARVADLGCGPGWYAQRLQQRGFNAVGLDVAFSMLVHMRQRAPGVPRVQADLCALPFTRQSLDAAWAINCYSHLPRHDLPVALAHLHAALRPEAALELTLADLQSVGPTPAEAADGESERRFTHGELPGRLFSLHTISRAQMLVAGAGFMDVETEPLANAFWIAVRARRARSLPDVVGPGLRLLVCGLNPSLYSADTGVPFARPGNRFWPAARAAGLVVRDRDQFDAFQHGIGMTDLCKRATASASELTRQEYAAGLRRVEALVRLYQPHALCFVGLDGWRRAVDANATTGWIPSGFGGRPAYLMPSTSGRNARVPLNELAVHLRTAASGTETPYVPAT